MMQISAFVGYDHRFPLAYAVTVRSLLKKSSFNFPVHPILLTDLIAKGDYNRPMYKEGGQMVDEISEHPMSTEFAISRFYIPYMANYQGWSLFCDSDFLFRWDIKDLFMQMDKRYAVMCVKHKYEPKETVKMDGQAQTLYNRKNWSSLMLFNNEHPKNKLLEPGLLNALPGRDFHAFSWLDDEDIGTIHPEWNWLQGHSPIDLPPKAVHFTLGTPDLEQYKNTPYSDEWRKIADEINMCKVR